MTHDVCKAPYFMVCCIPYAATIQLVSVDGLFKIIKLLASKQLSTEKYLHIKRLV